MSDWNAQATALLRAEMARRQVKPGTLAELLARYGEQETPFNLSKKIGRGTFSTAFFLKCMAAMDVGSINIAPLGTPAPADRAGDARAG